MILFKVEFKDNIAISANAVESKKQVVWTDTPKRILSIEVFANNNLQAIDMAQAKAEAWLKRNK